MRATGAANRIYATRDIVPRIATEHSDAVADARTESVAAPVARAGGVLVPLLLAFDDSRTLVDRPHSIWERVHGEMLGPLGPARRLMPERWSAVGGCAGFDLLADRVFSRKESTRQELRFPFSVTGQAPEVFCATAS